MLVFFSNRLGCLGSLLITLLLSALLFMLTRGCSGLPNAFRNTGDCRHEFFFRIAMSLGGAFAFLLSCDVHVIAGVTRPRLVVGALE